MTVTIEVGSDSSATTSMALTSIGIRRGAEWYNTHIALARPPVRGQPRRIPQVVLLTDDVANRQKAEAENIPTVSSKASPLLMSISYLSVSRTVRKYVEGMQEAEKLLDILSATGTHDVEETRAATTTRTALYANVCFILLNDTRQSC